MLDFISYKIGAVDIEKIEKRLVGTEASGVKMESGINALTYALRQAAKSQWSTEELVSQLKAVGAGVFSSPVIKTVKAVWTERGDSVRKDANLLRALSVGKVCDR